jgi:hypothetical protein
MSSVEQSSSILELPSFLRLLCERKGRSCESRTLTPKHSSSYWSSSIVARVGVSEYQGDRPKPCRPDLIRYGTKRRDFGTAFQGKERGKGSGKGRRVSGYLLLDFLNFGTMPSGLTPMVL